MNKREVIKMGKTITVNELLDQLQRLKDCGCGEYELYFRDWNDIDHEIEKGVHDNGEDWVALG
jgi:hypothetical protein